MSKRGAYVYQQIEQSTAEWTADKIKGVDTQLAEAEAKLKERIANLQDTVEKYSTHKKK